jgi:hypothetical protein
VTLDLERLAETALRRSMFLDESENGAGQVDIAFHDRSPVVIVISRDSAEPISPMGPEQKLEGVTRLRPAESRELEAMGIRWLRHKGDLSREPGTPRSPTELTCYTKSAV